jgi:hypothetical protein
MACLKRLQPFLQWSRQEMPPLPLWLMCMRTATGKHAQMPSQTQRAVASELPGCGQRCALPGQECPKYAAHTLRAILLAFPTAQTRRKALGLLLNLLIASGHGLKRPAACF